MTTTTETDSRPFLRQALATLAYRAGKAVRDAPPTFADFQIGERSRTPAQVLAHMGDLFDWGLWMAKGRHVWRESAPLPWNEDKGDTGAARR